MFISELFRQFEVTAKRDIKASETIEIPSELIPFFGSNLIEKIETKDFIFTRKKRK